MKKKSPLYQEEQTDFSDAGEKIQKKPFLKQHFWQIFTTCTTLLMILFGYTTVSLLISHGKNASSTAPVATAASTSELTMTPIATFAPTPTITPVTTFTPTPTLPAQSTVVCDTGSSDNWQNWPIQKPWEFLSTDHQHLLHDGSNNSTLIAPPVCQPKTPDYAVEAKIKPIDLYNEEFGLIARGGYTAEISSDSAHIVVAENDYICSQNVSADKSYHTYRLEVRGNEITLLIDGSSICSATDNRYLSPGQVGLSSSAQIEVTDFNVTLL